jgi:hypothetical protein
VREKTSERRLRTAVSLLFPPHWSVSEFSLRRNAPMTRGADRLVEALALAQGGAAQWAEFFDWTTGPGPGISEMKHQGLCILAYSSYVRPSHPSSAFRPNKSLLRVASHEKGASAIESINRPAQYSVPRDSAVYSPRGKG